MENTTLHTGWALPLMQDIVLAKHSIVITSLSLQPRKRDSQHPISLLWNAITTAAANGVLVTFILPQPSSSHPATAFNLSAAADLAAIGVRHVFAPPANLLHAKTAIIDEKIVWVGSGNWTAAASAHNREAYLRCESRAIAQKLRENWHACGFLGG